MERRLRRPFDRTLLAVDLICLGANLLKIFESGWLPLAVGASLMLVMLTWRQGTRILAGISKTQEVSLADFIAMMATSSITRAPGTAVFITGNPGCCTTSSTTKYCTTAISS